MTAPRPPALCPRCQAARAAWTAPRVDLCYGCLPGGPFTPPACTACGSPDYFCQGLCGRCHPGSPRYLGSCRECLAYGVLREHNWRCWGCRAWHARYPSGECPYCGRDLPLGPAGCCRLCWQQALSQRKPGEPPDPATACAHGHQLYFANLHQSRSTRQRQPPAVPVPGSRAVAEPFTPARWRQYPLFWLRPSLTALRQATAPDQAMSAHLAAVLREHATRHGWSPRQASGTRRSLAIIQAAQDTPGAPVRASEVEALSGHGVTVQSALEVLAAAGLLDDDRVPAVRRYLDEHTAGLPAAMTAQLEAWFQVMLNGSAQPPRRRPRHPATIRQHIMWMTPALRAWAARGITTLTEITPDDIRAALPARGAPRAEADQGLRSLFTVLKARKQLFTDPTRAIPNAQIPGNIPLPLDTAAIRQALDSPDPAVALAVALVAFHALTVAEVRHLQLTDIADGRLAIGGRSIPLAGPARARLAAWLDHRSHTWPATINPHLLINRKSAPRATPAGPRYPWTGLAVRPQALREDRILAEIHATGGDARRICDLFGMSISGALRYTTPAAGAQDQDRP